jgi:hypothetical protein
LYSCKTGSKNNGFAQKLATLSGKPVLAPIGFIELLDGGETIPSQIEWRLFLP